MTLSDSQREAEIDLALTQMMQELADAFVDEKAFDPRANQFMTLHQTTWTDILAQGWVRDMGIIGQRRYKLTGKGWIEGLRRTAQVDSQLSTERLGKICASLKRFVEGRNDDIVVDVNSVRTPDVPLGRLMNVIESGLLEKRFYERHMNVRWQHRGKYIWIPARFGMNRL